VVGLSVGSRGRDSGTGMVAGGGEEGDSKDGQPL